MKYILICLLIFGCSACNLARWNQKRLNKKLARNGIEEKTYHHNGDSIHYYAGGTGKTIVLLHGFGGDAQITWQKTLRALSENYRVVAPDLLWFGQSGGASKPNLQAQIDGMLALLKHLNIEDCTLTGVSYGGFVALGMLYEKPALFSKLCMIDSPGMTYNLSLLEELCRQENVDRLSDIFVPDTPQKVERLYNLSFYKNRNIPKGILQDVFQLYFTGNQEEQKQLLQTLLSEKQRFEDDTLEQFPPSMVFWGAQDEVFPIAEGKKLARYMNAKFVKVPDTGHTPNIENFKYFILRFKTFIEQ